MDKLLSAKEREAAVYDLLNELGIPYEKKEHEAVFTTEEAERLCTDLPGLKVKNLFVKDKKTKQFYLVVLQDDRRLDFKGLKAVTGWRTPTFASAEELWDMLKLTPGAVSAFGLMNDVEHRVTVVLDRQITEESSWKPINFHPCVNTATVAITLADFQRFLEHCGNPVLREDEQKKD